MTLHLQITKECFNWCKEQYFYNSLQSIWIVYVSALALLLAQTLNYFYFNYANHKWVRDRISHDDLYKIIRLLPHLALYLLIAFIIYELYFP